MRRPRPKPDTATPGSGSPPLLAGAGPALLGLRVRRCTAPFVFDDTKQQFALPTAADPLSVVDRSGAPHPHVHLLGQRPALARRHVLLPRREPADPRHHRAAGLPGHPAPAGVVGRGARRTALRSPFSARCSFCCTRCRPNPWPTSPAAPNRCAACSRAPPSRRFSIAARKAISWSGVALVVALFGAAVLTKEQAVVLPGALPAHRLLVEPRRLRCARCAPTGSSTSCWRSARVGRRRAVLEADHAASAPATAPASA